MLFWSLLLAFIDIYEMFHRYLEFLRIPGNKTAMFVRRAIFSSFSISGRSALLKSSAVETEASLGKQSLKMNSIGRKVTKRLVPARQVCLPRCQIQSTIG